MMDIKPIPTLYDGILFRSRIEARWKVFFNFLDVAALYEDEGYQINGIKYLVDFWIPEWSLYVEVKGAAPTSEEREKCRLLHEGTGMDVLCVYGGMDERSRRGILFTKKDDIDEYQDTVFMGCRRCDAIVLQSHEPDGVPWIWIDLDVHSGRNCGERYPIIDSHRIADAYKAAMTERFEGRSSNG